MDPIMIVACCIGALILGVQGYQIYQAKHPATAADGAPKAGVQAAVDDVANKIKAEFDKLGIPQSLSNIKQFAEVGIALAGLDGLRKLVDDVVPADRTATVDAAFDTIRTETASTLLKPAA